MIHNIFKNHSKEALYETFIRMRGIYEEITDSSDKAHYGAKLEAFMRYLHTRLTEKDFEKLLTK